ncbi:hypothetical protein QTG54_001121 [Skeletonema marinoi]|uniref:Uncharacterized protein n=1 Tax=Skeletonema marinoi TaxID=267567 RepID=A0AAD8YPT8_9STRA|nr:hypothetical protein QTG54_001121 [Skeletonema marinoi]
MQSQCWEERIIIIPLPPPQRLRLQRIHPHRQWPMIRNLLLFLELDTTRKLTAILSSNLLEGTDNNKYANELLLPTLQKQSRYWIPLLLGWLRQDDERIDNIDLPSSLDRHLPLTSKRIRQLQKKDGGSGGEVTVEVLKALALWSEWDLRTDKPSSTTTTPHH